MKDLIKIDQHNIWHPFTPLEGQEVIPIKKAKNATLYTEDGRKLIDAISSWWVNIHGHGNKKIASAIAKQAKRMEQVIFAGFTHKPAIKLSENLLSILPKEQSKIFFSDDGSTSTEVAIKLAIQFWFNQGKPRKKIIAIEGAYHGDTFGAMSIGDRSMFTQPFFDHLFEVDFIPFPEGDGKKALASMKKLATADTAAFIFEPLVQGAGGMRMYSPEVLDQLIEVARKKDVICIADEVMTGFGRTGKIFATDHLQNKPDIYCLSKGLTGGFLPMGITTANHRVVEVFKSDQLDQTFFHGHSYTANPIACAAANASMKILRSKSTQDAIERITKSHLDFMKTIEPIKKIKEIRSRGTIMAIEFEVKDAGYASNMKKKTQHFFLERNILIRPLGNVLYVLPPYVIKKKQLDKVYDAIREFLDQL